MVDEMMVTAERALIAKTAEHDWMAQQAADQRGRSTFSVGRLRHTAGAVLLRAGTRLQGAGGATPAGVLLTSRLTAME